MVDENFPNRERCQRQTILSASSCVDTDMDDLDVNGKQDTLNRSSYDTSTSSPESTSENAFSFNGSKFNLTDDKNEKKVHWNPTQIHSLLDCIEKRMCDFRKKSVQKSVWLGIGRDMLEHGDFSVEHCYNKWKNLRRDVRLFNNSNSMQKLSIRNAFIMERVQKMVLKIGYENSSRKSSSPISPNIDVTDASENAFVFSSSNTSQGDSWVSYNQSQSESYSMPLETVEVKEETVQDAQENQVNINNHTASIEDSIISLLSDPSVSQTILMNPKLLDEILPGLDIATLLKKFVDTHPEIVPLNVSNTQPMTNNDTVTNTAHISSYMQSKKPLVNDNNNGRQQFAVNGQNTSTVIDVGNSWPHQLYELLHSFREEETRQMHRLDQIVNYVQVMQESTKRRLSTINQLISLAGMLIPQR